MRWNMFVRPMAAARAGRLIGKVDYIQETDRYGRASMRKFPQSRKVPLWSHRCTFPAVALPMEPYLLRVADRGRLALVPETEHLAPIVQMRVRDDRAGGRLDVAAPPPKAVRLELVDDPAVAPSRASRSAA